MVPSPLKRYQEFPPPRDLAPLVECVWVLNPAANGGATRISRVLPDGASDLVISDRSAFVRGPSSTFRLMAESALTLGFRIRPGAAGTAFGVNPAELCACPVSFGVLWGRPGSEFEKGLANDRATVDLSAALADFLRQRVVDRAGLDGEVIAVVDRIHRAPGAIVRSLARGVGLSERHLRRRFESQVGMGIKHYVRIERFQRVLDATRRLKRGSRCSPPSWAQLAYEHGYADQAHLIREVRTFAGLTPVELFRTL
jgi:AraC-like DNA-binding protein